MELKEFFDNIDFDVSGYNNIKHKWSQYIINFLGNDYFIKMLYIDFFIFLEKYYKFEQIIYSSFQQDDNNFIHTHSFKNHVIDDTPKDYIKFNDMIKSILKNIEEYISENFRIKIEYEFYNIITKNKGIKLSNGLLIENDNIIENDIYDELVKKLNIFIKNKIKYFIDPNTRLIEDRKNKLIKINNKNKN